MVQSARWSRGWNDNGNGIRSQRRLDRCGRSERRPAGSLIEIRFPDGHTHVYQAMDTGGAIVGRRVDIYNASEAACRQNGVQRVEVRIIQGGHQEMDDTGSSSLGLLHVRYRGQAAFLHNKILKAYNRIRIPCMRNLRFVPGEVYSAERTGRVTKGAFSRLSLLRGIRIFERRIQPDLELPVLRQAGNSAVGAFTSRDKPRSSDGRLQPIWTVVED